MQQSSSQRRLPSADTVSVWLKALAWRPTYVPDAGVDVASLFEPEQLRSVGRVIESVRGSGIDGHGAGVGRRVWLLACKVSVMVNV